MSVFANKTVEVKADVQDLNSNHKKIKSFYIEIKSNNNKIQINSQPSLVLDYTALNNLKKLILLLMHSVQL